MLALDPRCERASERANERTVIYERERTNGIAPEAPRRVGEHVCEHGPAEGVAAAADNAAGPDEEEPYPPSILPLIRRLLRPLPPAFPAPAHCYSLSSV